MSVSTRVDLALLGFRGAPPVSRTAGAGPSVDGHLVIDGLNAAIPRNPDSPFAFDGTRVLLDGEDVGLDVEVVHRPRFYDLSTAEGVPYEKLARLHGRNVLATTVLDRTLVRAGESKPIGMKHFLRVPTAKGFKALNNGQLPTSVVIQHTDTGAEYTADIKWDANGTAVSSFQVPKDAKLGLYQITLTNGGEQAVLYCFAFFLLIFTGAGSFALDARRR